MEGQIERRIYYYKKDLIYTINASMIVLNFNRKYNYKKTLKVF